MQGTRIDDLNVMRRPSRWRARVRRVATAIAASALMAAGVIFTLQQAHPGMRTPGHMLQVPAMMAVAPAIPISEEASRVAKVLRRHTKDASKATRIANSLVTEGAKRRIDRALLIGVMLTEVDNLDTLAKSKVGARGLMQVMPFHSGQWGCASSNLFSLEANICHGVSILADNIRNSPNLRVALLRYNGCVRGKNTPGCGSYPKKVLRQAKTARGVLAVGVGAGAP